MARRRDKGQERAVAEDRIQHLVDMAGRAEPALADRYARLSLRIAERYQTGLPAAAKGRVCRACGAYLLPGRTSRTRITNGRVATTCIACGDIRRRLLAQNAAALPHVSRPALPSNSPRPRNAPRTSERQP